MTDMVKKHFLLLLLLLPSLQSLGQDAKIMLAKGDSLYAEKLYKRAVDCYKTAAENGNTEAQSNLAYAYYHGEGTDRDYAAAAMWYKRAAQQEFAKAQYNLAYCYMYGRGVPRNYDKAIDLLTASANNNFVQAQITLSDCYGKGVLVEQDIEESKKWRMRSQENNGAQEEKTEKPEATIPEKEKPRIVVKPSLSHLPEVSKEDTLATKPQTALPSEAEQVTVKVETDAPVIKILYPEDGAQFHTNSIKIKYQLLAKGMEKETKVIALVDGQKQPTDRAVRAANTIDVDLQSRDCNVMLYAQNAKGNSEPVSIRLVREKIVTDLPKLLVLAVGVGEYDDPQLPSLKYTCKDARDFTEAVKSKKGMPFSEVEAVMLLDSMATRENIHEGMQWLAQEAAPSDICMFFYAGHGYRDETDKFYFMSYGGKTNRLYNCFSAQEFRDEAQKINGKFVVFTDACYSAQLGERSAASDFTEQLRQTKKGMIMFASSASDTKSKEDDQWQNGAFTKVLVQAFQGAAKQPGDTGLSTQMLDRYLYDNVRKLTEYKQTPIFRNPNGIEPFNLFIYEE
jgi:hypothetical protein